MPTIITLLKAISSNRSSVTAAQFGLVLAIIVLLATLINNQSERTKSDCAVQIQRQQKQIDRLQSHIDSCSKQVLTLYERIIRQ